MLPSRLWKELYASVQDQDVMEIVELNEQIKEYGLALTLEEAKQLIFARDRALDHYGRVELGIEATKTLITELAASPYMDHDNFLSVLNELQEMFYYLKNETEDRIGDFELISMIRERFDGDCGGSMDLLKSNLEEYAEHFRREVQFNEFLLEGDDD